MMLKHNIQIDALQTRETWKLIHSIIVSRDALQDLLATINRQQERVGWGEQWTFGGKRLKVIDQPGYRRLLDRCACLVKYFVSHYLVAAFRGSAALSIAVGYKFCNFPKCFCLMMLNFLSLSQFHVEAHFQSRRHRLSMDVFNSQISFVKNRKIFLYPQKHAIETVEMSICT